MITLARCKDDGKLYRFRSDYDVSAAVGGLVPMDDDNAYLLGRDDMVWWADWAWREEQIEDALEDAPEDVVEWVLDVQSYMSDWGDAQERICGKLGIAYEIPEDVETFYEVEG